MKRIISLFSSAGIAIPLISTGIGIQDCINCLTSPNRSFLCLKTYSEIIDEVCERDFYLGLPYSGRSLIGNNNIGFPYFLPFGKLRDWASIPSEFQNDFSKPHILYMGVFLFY